MADTAAASAATPTPATSAAATTAAVAVSASAAAVPTPAVPTPAASAVPDTYDLSLPKDSPLDATMLERTAAIARELGLSNAAAQQLVELQAREATSHATAVTAANVEAALKAHQPGGAEWDKLQAQWKAEALTAFGDQPKLDAARASAMEVLDRFGSPELKAFLQTSGLGSYPAVVRVFAKIGAAMQEARPPLPGAVTAGTLSPAEEKLRAMYPSMYPSTA